MIVIKKYFCTAILFKMTDTCFPTLIIAILRRWVIQPFRLNQTHGCYISALLTTNEACSYFVTNGPGKTNYLSQQKVSKLLTMQFVIRNVIRNVCDICEDTPAVKYLNLSSNIIRILESGFLCCHKCGSNHLWICGLLPHLQYCLQLFHYMLVTWGLQLIGDRHVFLNEYPYYLVTSPYLYFIFLFPVFCMVCDSSFVNISWDESNL